MVINKIREALREQPFRPFVVSLTDGRRLPVPHPDFVAVAPESTVIVVDPNDGSISWVDAFLIVSLDYMNGQPQEARKPE